VLKRCVAAVCIAIVAGSIASGASAQNCDDRFPWTCQGYGGPPPPPSYYRPAPPFAPRDPYAQPSPYGQSPYVQPSPYAQPPYAQPPEARPGPIMRSIDPALRGQYAALYARVDDEPFPIPAVKLGDIDPEFLRKPLLFPTNEPAGTIIIDAQNHFLYFVQGGGRAIRYGVGVGRQGFGWSGVATVHDKQEWPDWYPPKEMLARQPELRRQVTELQSGIGVPGGLRNPLGARAMYLWQGNKDTLYRIHGTVEPWTIGQSVSSGCIRMINQDVIDLYQRVPVGARVVVLPARS
jgi:lipoprotein-anchoring transpeptidase ErfK/SrfK